MRLLSCSRVSCWVNWNCRDYINGINELWLPDVSALIKTAWWAKWTQADKRTGSILWAYRLLMKKSLLPLFSTGMNLECRDSKCLAGIRLGKQNAVTLGRKIQILRTKNILRIQMSLLCFFKCTAYSYFFFLDISLFCLHICHLQLLIMY